METQGGGGGQGEGGEGGGGRGDASTGGEVVAADYARAQAGAGQGADGIQKARGARQGGGLGGSAVEVKSVSGEEGVKGDAGAGDQAVQVHG
nr:hypothetical protein [Anaerolinea sp.]